jgi:hypothetical protein
VQPVYGPPPQPVSLKNGMTVELNLGLGWMTSSESDKSYTGIGGLSLGVGGWVSPQVAITGRIAGATISENGEQLSNIFFGPSLQYWVNDNFWLGGGIGLGILADNCDGCESVTGFGFDARVGYTFSVSSENTFNVSFELNPEHYSENGVSATITSVGILLGYQHL